MMGDHKPFEGTDDDFARRVAGEKPRPLEDVFKDDPNLVGAWSAEDQPVGDRYNGDVLMSEHDRILRKYAPSRSQLELDSGTAVPTSNGMFMPASGHGQIENAYNVTHTVWTDDDRKEIAQYMIEVWRVWAETGVMPQ